MLLLVIYLMTFLFDALHSLTTLYTIKRVFSLFSIFAVRFIFFVSKWLENFADFIENLWMHRFRYLVCVKRVVWNWFNGWQKFQFWNRKQPKWFFSRNQLMRTTIKFNDLVFCGVLLRLNHERIAAKRFEWTLLSEMEQFSVSIFFGFPFKCNFVVFFFFCCDCAISKQIVNWSVKLIWDFVCL